MKLRNNFQNSSEEAQVFGVEIRDEFAVFKIFEAKETMQVTIDEVN